MEKKNHNRYEAGFSLIEIFVVLIIVGILVTLAVVGFGASAASLDRQNIAREFKVALERARYDSVKRRPETCDDMSRVEILSSTSFRVFIDANRNGAIEAGESSLFDYTGRSRTTIVGDASLTYPVTIRFDERGDTSSGPCASPTAAYASTTFCESPCTFATVTPENSSVVYVSPTGTTALLAGGESIASVTAPTVSTVSPTGQINPLLAVWNALTGGGTPTPSPTPAIPTPTPATPTPTPDPGTPTPTPTPTTPTPTPTTPTPATPTPTPATPTPTPTPTPLPYCSTSPPYDRPGSPATCDCRFPMVVAHNGKCQP